MGTRKEDTVKVIFATVGIVFIVCALGLMGRSVVQSVDALHLHAATSAEASR